MASVRERAAVSAILRSCEHPVIVDLGAYDGADTEWMIAACGNRSPIVLAIEPDERNCAEIIKRDMAVWLWHAAIADHTGHCNFHSCEPSGVQGPASGSIRKPTGHLEHFEWCKFNDPGEVSCFTLDYILGFSGLDHIDILWVDIQGAERDMIAGGPGALKLTRYMFIEVERVKLYDGQALRDELLAMLPGWKIIEEFDFNILLKNEAFA